MVQLFNVIKIADIDETTISEELFDFIKKQEPVYKDLDFVEDLYSKDIIWEKIGDSSVKEEFRMLKSICEKNDCAYFRLITP